MVDPTRAPGYKPPADGSVPPVREEWREVAYYGLKSDSLALAIDFVVARTAARSDATTLAELTATIREEFRRVTDVLNAAIQPSSVVPRVSVAVAIRLRNITQK